jgi:poly(beta-D-mannuronate) lyase
MRIVPAILLITFATPLVAFAGGRQVATVDELREALSNGKPGDAIILRDGEWKDVVIDVKTEGTEAAPLTIRAQTPGEAILTGSSRLRLSASHVVVDGLLFQGGAIEKGQVIHFNSDHGRITNCAIVDYNPREVATSYYWVFFEGNHNRLDHCLLKGKNHQQPVIGNAGGGSGADDSKRASRHNTVDHCHFLDIPHVPGRNGREIFRIWGYGGNEELGDDGAFFTIEDNLFERAHGEGTEIISLKSNRNVVRRNTIRGTRGGITNRSGNFNRIEDNIILGDGQRGATGIRIAGQGHTVRGNYIEGTENGVNVMCGEFFESDLTGKFEPILREWAPLKRVPRYGWVRDATIAGNRLVDVAGPDFQIGTNYKSGWPGAQRVLLPEGLTIEKNVVIKSPQGGAIVTGTTADRTPPLDRFTFKPNVFRDNTFTGDAKIEFEPARDGFKRVDNVAKPKITPLTPADVGPGWRK